MIIESNTFKHEIWKKYYNKSDFYSFFNCFSGIPYIIDWNTEIITYIVSVYILFSTIMIVATDFISVSHLKTKTSALLKWLTKGKKIILSRNQPIGVLMSIEEYDKMVKLGFEPDEATPEEIKAYQESSHGKEWVEAFSFLDSLQ